MNNYTYFLNKPKLPKKRVTDVLVSGEFPIYAQLLEKKGITVHRTFANLYLDRPVQYHPDMQLCDFGDGHMFALKGSGLQEKLSVLDVQMYESEKFPEKEYPHDVLCNALILGKYILGNQQGLDEALILKAGELGYQFYHVNQGYTACTVCVVDKKSIITADKGIAKLADKLNINVLLISNTDIILNGYSTGFIGGCCGKISETEMVFTGSLEMHPDCKKIKSFLLERNIEAIELLNSPLVDIGGIIPLKECSY